MVWRTNIYIHIILHTPKYQKFENLRTIHKLNVYLGPKRYLGPRGPII